MANVCDGLQANLQRVTGTQLDAQGAANVWAGTTGLSLIGALNAKAGITNPNLFLDLNAAVQRLTGSPGTDTWGDLTTWGDLATWWEPSAASPANSTRDAHAASGLFD